MKPQLTGRVFVRPEEFRDRAEYNFQLEAEVDGSLTRLASKEDFPEDCLYDVRHEITAEGPLESIPMQYPLKCSCGNKWTMTDINEFYKERDTFQ